MIDRFNVWHHKKEDSKKSTPWKQAGKGDQDEQEAVSEGQLFQQYQPQPYTYNNLIHSNATNCCNMLQQCGTCSNLAKFVNAYEPFSVLIPWEQCGESFATTNHQQFFSSSCCSLRLTLRTQLVPSFCMFLLLETCSILLSMPHPIFLRFATTHEVGHDTCMCVWGAVLHGVAVIVAE
jgi:hypothetical protein